MKPNGKSQLKKQTYHGEDGKMEVYRDSAGREIFAISYSVSGDPWRVTIWRYSANGEYAESQDYSATGNEIIGIFWSCNRGKLESIAHNYTTWRIDIEGAVRPPE